MPLDPARDAAGDGLAEADQLDRLDVERGLLADLANDRLLQCFAKLDAAAGQRIDALGRRPPAPWAGSSGILSFCPLRRAISAANSRSTKN